MPYRIEISPEARDHLRTLTARQRDMLLDEVQRQLTQEPIVPTRNRKRMRPNDLATWELRAGDLRAYYDVLEARTLVRVLAVGVKLRNRVRIGREVIDL